MLLLTIKYTLSDLELDSLRTSTYFTFYVHVDFKFKSRFHVDICFMSIFSYIAFN